MRTTKRGWALFIATILAALAAGAREPQPAGEHGRPRGRSKQEILLQDPLHAIPGKQAHLLRIEYPPGWVGQRHYHTGDVFLYVLSGAFTVDVDGAARTTIRAGESYHEALDKVMQARNASATEATTILLFQVGNQGERMTVVTDE
jgi:quercetin dioxygenase-like cupin family protein